MVIKDLLPWNDRKYDDFQNPRSYQQEDCVSCRVLGAGAFMTLGTYTYYSGMKQLRERQNIIRMSKSKYKTGSRQLGIISLSSTLVGLGIYRLLN